MSLMPVIVSASCRERTRVATLERSSDTDARLPQPALTSEPDYEQGGPIP